MTKDYILGSLSDDEGDGDENFKKAIGVISKRQFCMCSTPLVCFLTVPARPRRENSLCDVFLEDVHRQIINNNSVPNSVQIII